jgi:hypothetical protein
MSGNCWLRALAEGGQGAEVSLVFFIPLSVITGDKSIIISNPNSSPFIARIHINKNWLTAQIGSSGG